MICFVGGASLVVESDSSCLNRTVKLVAGVLKSGENRKSEHIGLQQIF